MKRFASIASSVLAAAALAGCSSIPAQQTALSAAPAEGRLSLAAGDALGRSIYVNDVVLAAAAAQRNSAYATGAEPVAPSEAR